MDMDFDRMTDEEIDAYMLGAAVANINSTITHQYGKPLYVRQDYTWAGKTVRVWRHGAETISMTRGMITDFADSDPGFELSYLHPCSIDARLLGACVAHINSVPTHEDGHPLHVSGGYTHGGNTVRVWRDGAEVVKMVRLEGIHSY